MSDELDPDALRLNCDGIFPARKAAASCAVLHPTTGDFWS